MTPLCLVDGKQSGTVPADDRGLQYGDGVFETIAAPGGRPELPDAHFDRLARGAAALGIGPVDKELLGREVRALCEQAGASVIKVIVTRGSSNRGYRPPDGGVPRRVVSAHDWPQHDPDLAELGIDAMICKTRLPLEPQFAGLKTLNRLPQVIAAREVGAAGAREGIMLDTTERVVCGTMSNVFVVKDGELRTPDLAHGGVAGIVRDRVIAGAGALGIRSVSTALRVADLHDADEIFVTNSVIGLWPVARFDGRQIGLGPVSRACRDRLMTLELERKSRI